MKILLSNKSLAKYSLIIFSLSFLLVSTFLILKPDKEVKAEITNGTTIIENTTIPEETVSYTSSSETHCSDGKCTLSLYSGVRFANSNGTKIEDVKSLKYDTEWDVWDILYLENDTDFTIDVIDYNFTSIIMNIHFTGGCNDYPTECSVCSENVVKCKFKHKHKEKNYTYNETLDEWVEKETEKEYEYEYEYEDGIVTESQEIKGYFSNPLGKEFSFGGNSTTIMLQDANTENLEDAYMYEPGPDTPKGTGSYMYCLDGNGENEDYYSIIKFNISQIPSGQRIDDAVFYFYILPNNLDSSAEGYNVSAHHVNESFQWIEETITWNTMPTASEYNTTADDVIRFFGGTGEPLNWQNFSVTSMTSIAYNDNEVNLTIFLRATDYFGAPHTNDYIQIYAKEYTINTALRPYLNITYSEVAVDETPPTYSLNSTNETIVSKPCNFTLLWDDETGLATTGGYIFSTNNTGTWSNSSWIAFTTKPQNATSVTVLNSTVGTLVQWKYYANDTSNNWNTSLIYNLTTTAYDVTPPAFEIISQTPSDIAWNSTGSIEIMINITDTGNVNESSIFFAHGVNHTHDSFYEYNWSWRYPSSPKQPDMRRADDRNESYGFENIIWKETSDDIWSFAGHDLSALELTVKDNSTVHTYINFTDTTIQHFFPQVWPVDRTDMQEENKTGQYIEIHKNNWVRLLVYPKMMHNYTAENYTIYFYWNIEEQNSPKPIDFFFCNSTYSTSNPTNNDNCEYIGALTKNDQRDLTIRNSSYFEMVAFIHDGYFGDVKLTDSGYIILKTDSPTSKAYRFYYANDTVADNTDFQWTNTSWTSTNSGGAWTYFNGTDGGTPDFWISDAQQDYDKIMYYLYACDDYGNCDNSTMHIDIMEAEPNHPPIAPLIESPIENQNVTGVFNVTWQTLGDVESDEYNASVYLYNSDGTYNSTLANNNITQGIEYYEFNTTPIDSGKYRINVTLCDDSGFANNCSSSITGYNFTIYHTYTKAVIQTFSLIDLPSRLLEGFREIMQATIFTDIIERLYSALRTLAQLLNLVDVISRLYSGFRTLTQNINITDIVSRLRNVPREISQVLNITDTVSRLYSSFRSLIQTLTIADLITRLRNVPRELTQSLNITDFISRISSSLRTIIQNITISDILTSAFGVLRSLIQSLKITDIVSRLRNVPRTLSQLLNITTVVDRLYSGFRTIIQTINISNILSRIRNVPRTIIQSLNITDAVSRLYGSFRTMTQVLNLTTVLSRLSTLSKTLSQSLKITDALSYVHTGIRERILSLALTITDVLSRISSSYRAVSQSLTLTALITSIREIPRTLTQTIYIFPPANKTYTVNQVWTNAVANKPPLTYAPAGETSVDITNITSSDNEYIRTTSSDYPYHKFLFLVEEEDIRWIEVTWEGHTNADGTIYLYVWNYTEQVNGNWTELDSGTGTTDFTLSKIIYDVSDIISGENVTILTQDPGKVQEIVGDSMMLKIGYVKRIMINLWHVLLIVVLVVAGSIFKKRLK